MTDVNQLVEAHIDLAQSAARKTFGLDDQVAMSAAMHGLWMAAQAWQPSRGASFKTHADRRIAGCIKEEFTRLGRKKRIPAKQCVSIDDEEQPEIGHEADTENSEMQSRMQRRLRLLPVRARVVLTGFSVGLAQADIAFMLGLSNPMIARWKECGFHLFKHPQPLALTFREKRNRRLMRCRILKIKYLMRGLTKSGRHRKLCVRPGARRFDHDAVRSFHAKNSFRETLRYFGMSRGALQHILRNKTPKVMELRGRVSKLIRLWSPVITALEA